MPVPLNRHRAAAWALGVAGLAAPLCAWPAGGAIVDADAAQSADEALLLFDIPAQPLEAALDQFAVVTGRSALFSSAMVADRTSAPVRGRYTPERALRHMLAGTGLAAQQAVAGRVAAFVIRQADPADEGSNAAGRNPVAQARLAAYDELLQDRVWVALCARPLTAAPNYQSVLRFEVTQSGRLGDPRLVGSTGDPRRDAALLDALGSVRIGQPPPAELVQPVTLLILPGRADRAHCPGARG
ncbi:Outer membrane receptor for ferric coprogen and ferric-rhodotorulic acid [Bordetella ansorpii]|uniref:Outer membrane receptor for ferric coprogen and ferric-rhodotorulic acid n=1 Tax=Bordetella ansorpii TaxID=288768 RepID=A0A157SXM0_9BORD|nr:secretin and TonB N-terminal domain-containing protein [Bordetella ansorpii]SAI74793.1 Outer membrane receptor for ferric coprogen and ferric-rhodotorulic acid [Bordetella ansorpii]